MGGWVVWDWDPPPPSGAELLQGPCAHVTPQYHVTAHLQRGDVADQRRHMIPAERVLENARQDGIPTGREGTRRTKSGTAALPPERSVVSSRAGDWKGVANLF